MWQLVVKACLFPGKGLIKLTEWQYVHRHLCSTVHMFCVLYSFPFAGRLRKNRGLRLSLNAKFSLLLFVLTHLRWRRCRCQKINGMEWQFRRRTRPPASTKQRLEPEAEKGRNHYWKWSNLSSVTTLKIAAEATTNIGSNDKPKTPTRPSVKGLVRRSE